MVDGWAPVHSVVVAGAEDALDEVKLLVSARLAGQHLGHLLALTRGRGEELTQEGDALRRRVELRGGLRIRRLQRRDHLPVIASGVDERSQVPIGGRETGPGGQRQCQAANPDSESGQRWRGQLDTS